MNRLVKLALPLLLLLCAGATFAADKWEPKKAKLSAKDGTVFLDTDRRIRDFDYAIRDAAARLQALQGARGELQGKADALLKPYFEGMKLDPAKTPWGFALEEGEVVITELPQPSPAPSPPAEPPKK